jgi:arginyl-tRNA synthetase
MPSIPAALSKRIELEVGIDPELRPATKWQFGHYQSNVALRLANTQGRKPRDVAADIVSRLDVADLCEPIEIAGPGFLNLRIRPDVLAAAVNDQIASQVAGIEPDDNPKRVVIDYSSPNVAKQMHVGHLRTTIIGDCFTRVLSATGNTVIRQNHVGDWGRQFGMLIEQIGYENLDLDTLDLPGAEQLYLRAQRHLDSDEAFEAAARDRVVLLQGGDEATLSVWKQLIAISTVGFNQTYARLGVLLTDDDMAGESSYNDSLAGICDDLETRGIAVHDGGALVVFAPGFDAPAILRNSAGGYGYDVTDVAALLHRVRDLKADRLIYVTDARQSHHFQLLFAVCRRAGYLPDSVSAEHIGYGMVLGQDGTPFKTREGTAVHLDDLLDEAERLVAPEIALAAIKYADLSNQLQKDYVFDAKRMTADHGDTGPYLQYAHARTCQILRRAAATDADTADAETADAAQGASDGQSYRVTVLSEPVEQTLALELSKFADVVTEVAESLMPHKLCTYLFALASSFSSFYEQCPVLKSEGEVLTSRLALCEATGRVLATGLGLLGIPAPEWM